MFRQYSEERNKTHYMTFWYHNASNITVHILPFDQIHLSVKMTNDNAERLFEATEEGWLQAVDFLKSLPESQRLQEECADWCSLYCP